MYGLHLPTNIHTVKVTMQDGPHTKVDITRKSTKSSAKLSCNTMNNMIISGQLPYSNLGSGIDEAT